MTELTGAVASRILLLLLVVAVGVWARRSGRLDAASVAGLSRVVVDFAYPALVFTRLLGTVSPAALAAEWPVPVAAALSLAGGWLAARRLLRDTSAAWLAGLPNWIFLPLLIAEATHGAAGVRTVLLFNIGAELCLWTLGVGLLIGARDRAAASTGAPSVNTSVGTHANTSVGTPANTSVGTPANTSVGTPANTSVGTPANTSIARPPPLWRSLLRNFGLWAAILGTTGALLSPSLSALAAAPRTGQGLWAPLGLLIEALGLLGALAVPGSLLVTGGLLGEVPWATLRRPTARLLKVIGLRLAVAPALGFGVLTVVAQLGLHLPPTARFMLLITWAMPVAISGSVYLKRFGGDAALGSQAVVWSTILSLLTVPAWVAVFMASVG